MAAYELPEMPCGPVMELHGQRKRFHVPFGLKPLLEEMTREILRYQPEDIFAFLSKYMELRLAKRDETKSERRASDPRWNSTDGPDLLTEEELEDMLKTLKLSKEEADKNATKIQALFRGHKTRKSLEAKLKELHEHHGDHRKSWQWKKWSWEGSSVLPKEQLGEFLDDLGVDLETANKHATKIQAAFRGHSVRRAQHAHDEHGEDEDENEDEGEDEDEDEDEEEGYWRGSTGDYKRGSQDAPKKSMDSKRGSSDAPKRGSMESKRGSGQNPDLPEGEMRGSMQSKRGSGQNPDSPDADGQIRQSMQSKRGSGQNPDSPDDQIRQSMQSKRGSGQNPDSPDGQMRQSMQSKRGSGQNPDSPDGQMRQSMQSKRASGQNPDSPDGQIRQSMQSKRGSAQNPESPSPKRASMESKRGSGPQPETTDAPKRGSLESKRGSNDPAQGKIQ